ncbi:hypothetical protein [Paracoccus bogoriensis]|nr:hypothetical protein [Paracoccus bogoriensis]
MLLILGASGILPAALAAIVRHLILSRERVASKTVGTCGRFYTGC